VSLAYGFKSHLSHQDDVKQKIKNFEKFLLLLDIVVFYDVS